MSHRSSYFHHEPTATELEINRIRGLMEAGGFAPALDALEPVLGRHPRNRDALYMRAACQRYLHRIPEALATLERLEGFHPGFSRLFQERGHCFVQLRDAPRAIEAFIRAVNLNPALPSSWSRLELLYRMVGEEAQARTAAAHVTTLGRLSPEVVVATGLFSDGDWAPAENIIRQYLQRHPNDVEAMRLLARIGLELDVLDDGEALLAAVLQLAPDYQAARFDYVRALLQRHKHAQAGEQVDKLLAADPGNRSYRMSKASVLVGLGDHEGALALYRALLGELPPKEQDVPGSPLARERALLHISVAHSLKTLGRQAEAVDEYVAAAAARRDFGDAYWSLANLKTYRFDEAQLSTMRQLEAAPTTQPEDRYHLCFALGKCLEDAERYAESFEYYARGNALKKAESGFRMDAIERNARDQQRVCTPALFERFKGSGCAAPDPIFIVGLPRAGSTLLEQILASHSQVEGTAELSDIQRIVLELTGRAMTDEASPYPANLADQGFDSLRRYGEQYLRDTRAYRSGKPFFIDKMPNNFRHIGLIHLILPNAKIIDARREPMACCFSNFKQLFASGQEFTYSFEDIARYYRSYVELMRHWDAVLPGKVLRVQHEAVVEDLEGNVRRILQFCGLEFEPACLEFHRTRRSIRTASSEQVRRPIFKEGLDQWRHFEPWLEPLKQALGPEL